MIRSRALFPGCRPVCGCGICPGEVLLDLARDDLQSDRCRRLAKRVMRVLIDYLLQGRPLNSRSLFTHLRGESHES